MKFGTRGRVDGTPLRGLPRRNTDVDDEATNLMAHFNILINPLTSMERSDSGGRCV